MSVIELDFKLKKEIKLLLYFFSVGLSGERKN